MRFASRCCPSRAFPPRGAVPALAGPCFLAGSLSVLRPARRLGCFTIAFPVAPAHEPGRRFLAVAESGRLVAPEGAPHVPSTPRERRARRLRTARPLRSFAPPGGPFRTTLALARRRPDGRCSPGVVALQSSLHHGPGSVFRAGARAELDAPAACVVRNPAVAVAGRDPDSDPELMSPGSVDVPRLKNAAHHRRAATQLTCASRAHRAPAASPVSCARERMSTRSVLLVPPLGGTPRLPCPSRHDPPPRGTHRWTSKTQIVEP
jgi:hypothetical protein